MNAEENKAIVRKLIEAMDRGAPSILDEVCAPDLRVHFNDRELDLVQVREAAAGFNAAFPDLRHTGVSLSAEGDHVTLRAVDCATHLGIYRGLAPTGKPVEFETHAVYRITNGRIVEIWQQMDVEGLLKQLE